MQRDAIERHRLHRLMLEPEMLASIEPDVHLVGTLVALADALPAESRETARQVVREVVEAIEKRIGETTRSALRGRWTVPRVPIGRGTPTSTGTGRCGRT